MVPMSLKLLSYAIAVKVAVPGCMTEWAKWRLKILEDGC